MNIKFRYPKTDIKSYTTVCSKLLLISSVLLGVWNVGLGQANQDFTVSTAAVAGSVVVGTNVNSARGTTASTPTKGYQQFQWTVPCGVTSIRVEVWGAGGGGSGRPSGSPAYAGAGGGGGAYARKMSFSVTPGQILYVQVGRGGQGSNQGSTNPFPRAAGGGTSYVKTGSHGGTIIASADGGDGAGNGSTSSTGGGGISGSQNYTINSASPTTNDQGYWGGGGGGGSGGTRGGGGGGGAGSAGSGGNGGSNTTTNPPGGTGGIAQTVLYTGLAGSTGGSCSGVNNQGSTPTERGGGGGGSGSGFNGTGGNGGNGFVRITYTAAAPSGVLQSNGLRNEPLGPQCSGSTLNFVSNPTGGYGSYEYSWSTSPASSTSTSNTFSPILTNTGCTDMTYTINLSVTSCGTITNQIWTPNIKPIPALTLDAVVNCGIGLVTPSGGACSADYILQSCTGCMPTADAVGTIRPSGVSFNLIGGTSAAFSATLNGCSSANQSLNFLAAPFNCLTSLSAELNQFNVVCGLNYIELNWIIDSQEDNDYFTIERSIDGLNFELMKKVPGSGTTNASESYDLRDERPLPGTSYYRLSQTDFDGQKTVLGTLSSEWPCKDQSDGIRIFPNPTEGDVNLLITRNDREDYSVHMCNSVGQTVIPSIEVEGKEKGETQLRMRTSELPSGVYLIKVILGDKVFTEKLLIKE